MIFTIGYRRITTNDLIRIAFALSAVVIDCRARQGFAKSGFGKRQLAAILGDAYKDHGHHLGGGGNVRPSGIDFLRPFAESPDENVLLLCAEEAPGDCHRHHDITAPHFPMAIHIYRDELVTSGALARAIETGEGYESIGSLSEILDAA